ncbi:hypothetical protein GS415_02485 [Rhodococcus hoagii]|nr:hypothetical protein [Prescottella equi]
MALEHLPRAGGRKSMLDAPCRGDEPEIEAAFDHPVLRLDKCEAPSMLTKSTRERSKTRRSAFGEASPAISWANA